MTKFNENERFDNDELIAYIVSYGCINFDDNWVILFIHKILS